MPWARVRAPRISSSRSMSARMSDHADLASARAVLDLDAPQLKGAVTVTAKPAIAALARDRSRRAPGAAKSASNRSCRRSRAVRCWPCWDSITRSPRVGVRRNSRDPSSGTWHAPLRLKARMTGAGLDADAQGTAGPWAPEPDGQRQSDDTAADFTPLFDLKPADRWHAMSACRHGSSLAGGKLTLDDLDGSIAGSRLRGHIVLTLGDAKERRGRSRSRHA